MDTEWIFTVYINGNTSQKNQRTLMKAGSTADKAVSGFIPVGSVWLTRGLFLLQLWKNGKGVKRFIFTIR